MLIQTMVLYEYGSLMYTPLHCCWNSNFFSFKLIVVAVILSNNLILIDFFCIFCVCFGFCRSGVHKVFHGCA